MVLLMGWQLLCRMVVSNVTLLRKHSFKYSLSWCREPETLSSILGVMSFSLICTRGNAFWIIFSGSTCKEGRWLLNIQHKRHKMGLCVSDATSHRLLCSFSQTCCTQWTKVGDSCKLYALIIISNPINIHLITSVFTPLHVSEYVFHPFIFFIHTLSE